MAKCKRYKKIPKWLILIVFIFSQLPLTVYASQEAKNMSDKQLTEDWYWDDNGDGYKNSSSKLTTPSPTIEYLNSSKNKISKSKAVINGYLHSDVKYIKISWSKTGSNVFLASSLKVYVPSKDKDNIKGLNFGFSNFGDGTNLMYMAGNGGTGTTMNGTQANGTTTWTISVTKSNLAKLQAMNYLCVDSSTEGGQYSFVSAFYVHDFSPVGAIDTTSPSASIVASTESWTKDSVVLTMRAKDDESGLDEMLLQKKDGNTWSTIETYSIGGSTTEQIKTYTLEEEQEAKQYRLVANDKMGNSKETNTVSVNIDKTAPTTAITLSGNYATSHSSVSLLGVDSLSGLAVMTIQSSLTGDFNTNSSDLYSYYFQNSKDQENKTYQVRPTVKTYYRVKATDLAGNIGYSTSVFMQVDNTKPTMTAEPQSQSYKNNNVLYYKDSLSPKGTGYDTESGIDTLYFISEADARIFDSETMNPWTRQGTYTSDVINLFYYCSDKAGNESQRYQNTYYVDKTAPTLNYCTLNIPQMGGMLSSNSLGQEISFNKSLLPIFPALTSSLTVAGGDKWINYDCYIDVSAKDTQTGLSRFVLQKYVNSQWINYNTIKADGEVVDTEKSFTVGEYGSYRVAVYDNFDHVTFTSDTKSYIDKVAPQITLEKEIYGWTKENVTVKAHVTDELSGIKSFELINQENGNTVTEGSISEDLLIADIQFEEDSEGITKFLAIATDYSGNISKKEIIVKIDKTAPIGEVNVVYDGYNMDVDIKNIVEEHSGCDRAWIEVSDINEEVESKTYELALTSGSNMNNGASFQGTATLYKDFTMCDSVLVVIKISDKVENIRTLQSQVYDVFKLEGYIERNLGQAEYWKKGETGIVHANASAYVDNVEIIFPDEFIEKDDSLADINYEYNGNEYIAVIGHDFTIPLYVENDTYTITIRAYKNGRMKEINPYINANGSILDTIRRRVRYRLN